MARNLNDLAKSLEAKAKRIEVAASEVAVKVAAQLLDSLVWRTPVDTSAALSNWQISFDSPLGSFIQPYVPGYLGYTQSASASEAIATGLAKLKDKKPGQVIYIVNNTPYIRGLNAGTSKQAPAGFVEGSVMIVRKNMPTIKL